MNASISVRLNTKPTMVEFQQELHCGKHAINNLLQQSVATCSGLKTIARNLSRSYNIKLCQIIHPNGYYDVSVLLRFLMMHKFRVDVLAEREIHKDVSRRQSDRFIGYLFGDGVHWVSIRRYKRKGQPVQYYVLDSLSNQAVRVRVSEWLRAHPQLLGIKVYH